MDGSGWHSYKTAVLHHTLTDHIPSHLHHGVTARTPGHQSPPVQGQLNLLRTSRRHAGKEGEKPGLKDKRFVWKGTNLAFTVVSEKTAEIILRPT